MSRSVGMGKSGAVRLTRQASEAGDPSLRLKNGCAQDDTCYKKQSFITSPKLNQFESCELCVDRSFRRQLALVQKKLVGGHRTKVGSGERGEFFLQALKVAIGTVFFAPARRARSAGSARQREMRTVGAVFFRDAECGCGLVDGCGEDCQLWAGFHADPKDAG